MSSYFGHHIFVVVIPKSTRKTNKTIPIQMQIITNEEIRLASPKQNKLENMRMRKPQMTDYKY